MKKIKESIILAAGLGTRLRPLTNFMPKPLIPIFNKPSISYIFDFLLKIDISKFYINLFYKSEQLLDYIKFRNFDVDYVIERELMGTAGGIRHFINKIDEDVIVVNSDIMTNINISQAINYHIAENNLVTLILIDYPLKNNVKIDDNKVVEFLNKPSRMAKCFSGISILNKRLSYYLTKYKYSSIIDVYKMIMNNEANEKISYFYINSSSFFWYDIGTIFSYWKFHYDFFSELNVENVRIDNNNNIIFGNSQVNGLVTNSVVWDNVNLQKNYLQLDKYIISQSNIFVEVY